MNSKPLSDLYATHSYHYKNKKYKSFGCFDSEYRLIGRGKKTVGPKLSYYGEFSKGEYCGEGLLEEKGKDD